MSTSDRSLRAWSVLGNSQKLDGGAMFGNAPRPMWEKWIAPDELGRIPLACRALLVELDGKRFLCETGIGAFFEPTMAARYGIEEPTRHILLENLNSLGFSDSDIDYVILSHLHFDHAGGLLPSYANQQQPGGDQLLFPKAKYVVGREAWERAQKPHFRDRASFIPGLVEKLSTSGRLVIVNGDQLPGPLGDKVKFIYSHGHTPGQMHTHFIGSQAHVVFAGDLIPGTAWVHLPITMGYDRFPEKLIEEKQSLYTTAVLDKWWVFYTHDPRYCASRVISGDKGRFVPDDFQETWQSFSI